MKREHAPLMKMWAYKGTGFLPKMCAKMSVVGEGRRVQLGWLGQSYGKSSYPRSWAGLAFG